MSVIRTGVEVRIRETDLTDPTCGLRAGLVDVALTRGPFDETGPTMHELRVDPVGAVLRADDPLARRDRPGLGRRSKRTSQAPRQGRPRGLGAWRYAIASIAARRSFPVGASRPGGRAGRW